MQNHHIFSSLFSLLLLLHHHHPLHTDSTSFSMEQKSAYETATNTTKCSKKLYIFQVYVNLFNRVYAF